MLLIGQAVFALEGGGGDLLFSALAESDVRSGVCVCVCVCVLHLSGLAGIGSCW